MTTDHGKGDGSALRWALAGYGAGGRVYHAPLLSAAAGLELVAVVTANPARRDQALANLPGITPVDRLDDLPGLGVAGVTISTPPDTHVPLTHRALDLGLHVVLDKPFALTANEARGLLAHAREVGRMLMPYQNRRWDSDFRTVRELVRSGRLGRVHRFTSRLDRLRPIKPGWAGGTVADGAGVLLDLGPHLIDQAVQLFGPVDSVYAELLTVRSGAEAEDDFQLQLMHRGGVRSTLAASLAAAAAGPRFQINGDAGGFVIDGSDGQEQALKDGLSPAQAGENWGVEPVSAYGTLATADGARRWPSERGRWDLIYPAVAAAIATGGPAPADPADAVHTAEIIDTARISAQNRTVATVPVERQVRFSS